MIKIFICDDSKEILECITNYVNDFILFNEGSLQHVDVLPFTNPHELLKNLKKVNELSIYILDIDMNTDINGLDVAERIRTFDSAGIIIFVTAHDQYLPESVNRKLSILQYIIKDSFNLRKQINSALELSLKRFNNLMNQCVYNPIPLVIKKNRETNIYDQRKIICIHTSENQHQICIEFETKSTICWYSLSRILQQLNEELFNQCNKGTIVNISHISKINPAEKTILLDNDLVVPISRRNYPSVKFKLDNYLSSLQQDTRMAN